VKVVLAGTFSESLAAAFASDQVVNARLGVSESSAFELVHEEAPDAVVMVPNWLRTGDEEVAGCWWFSRAGHLAKIPVVLLSTAAVFNSVDRTPRSEFDQPAPTDVHGKRAYEAEVLLQRTTRRAVIVRTGPTDDGSLRDLLAAAVVGGADATVTPLSHSEVGRLLRELTVARRYGVWHLAGEQVSLRECARRLGVPPPTEGASPVPPPLQARLLTWCDQQRPQTWPSAR
jgi:hypothetical protein